MAKAEFPILNRYYFMWFTVVETQTLIFWQKLIASFSQILKSFKANKKLTAPQTSTIYQYKEKKNSIYIAPIHYIQNDAEFDWGPPNYLRPYP